MNLKTLVSAFFYPETRTKLEAMGRIDPECRFAEFGNAEAEIPLPFLRFDEYAEILGHFRANIVRGENSAVKAILAGKPFLWDFYKEKNGAHAAKIEDFLLFTEPFFERREDFQTYAEATRAFNSDVFGKPEIETCLKILVRPSPETLRAFASMGKEVSERDMTKRILSEIG